MQYSSGRGENLTEGCRAESERERD